MVELTGYLLVFLGLGIFFVFIHLMMGKVVRPAKPDSEKLTIYECGEPTIGSAWIQFDLRYYVVALLFVIFDVEVVFFFPWAVVFGKANQLARADLPAAERQRLTEELIPRSILEERQKLSQEFGPTANQAARVPEGAKVITPEAAQSLAWIAFWDIMVFFGVLLVGFAYLWKRGDLDWVRSTAAELIPPSPAPETARTAELVGAER